MITLFIIGLTYLAVPLLIVALLAAFLIYSVQSNFDRDTAIRLAEANRINQGFSAIEIFFAADAEHIREVMRL